MCNHSPNRASAETHAGQRNGRPFGCDPCIQPLITALNDGGIPTVASCCGHGQRPGRVLLDDGRELFIVASYEEGDRLDALIGSSEDGDAAGRVAGWSA